MHRTLIALMAAGCGGAPKPPPPRPQPSPAVVAALLDRDLAELADLAHRLRDRCAALVTALPPLVARMRIHFDEVDRFAADPQLGPAFKAEVAAYGERAAGRGDRIGEDLGATYLRCPPDLKERLRATIDLIPSV